MDKTVLTNATIRAMVVTLLMVFVILDAIQAGKGITAATVSFFNKEMSYSTILGIDHIT